MSVSKVNSKYRSEALALTEKFLGKTQLLIIFYSVMKFRFFYIKSKNLKKKQKKKLPIVNAHTTLTIYYFFFKQIKIESF